MSNPFTQRDQSYYRTLINQFVEEFPWVFTEDAQAVEEAMARAAATPPAVGELRLAHLYTDATMYVRFPEYRDKNAAQVVLSQPLDCALPPAEERFIGSLARSHAMIAGIYQSEYIKPQSNPEVILHGCVPLNYSESKLYSMLTAIDATALRVQRLHDDIKAPISELLAGQDTMSTDHSPDSRHYILTKN